MRPFHLKCSSLYGIPKVGRANSFSVYIKCPHIVPQSQKYIIIVALTDACDKWMDFLKSIQDLYGREFDVNTSLSLVPDTLHVQKLEHHEIGTNLFRKNFMMSSYDADVFNIIG
jgi:hypothetical protein